MTEEREFHPISVAEFIEALRSFPPHWRVLVRGYESGYDDPEAPRHITAKVDDYDSSVYGDYEDADPYDKGAFMAVLIDRRT
jgi:hypothetical protein